MEKKQRQTPKYMDSLVDNFKKAMIIFIYPVLIYKPQHEIISRLAKSSKESSKKESEFLKKIDTLIFVGGKNSSNTNALFEVCKKILPNSFFIEDEKEINIEWFKRSENIGISGSASTPKWLMEKVRTFLNDRLYKKVESK